MWWRRDAIGEVMRRAAWRALTTPLRERRPHHISRWRWWAGAPSAAIARLRNPVLAILGPFAARFWPHPLAEELRMLAEAMRQAGIDPPRPPFVRAKLDPEGPYR